MALGRGKRVGPKAIRTGSQRDVGVMAWGAGSRGRPWFRDAWEALERRSLGGTRGPAVCTQCVSVFQERLGPGNRGEMGVSERPLRSLPLPLPCRFRSNPGGGVLQGWRMEWAPAPAVRGFGPREHLGPSCQGQTTPRPAAGWAQVARRPVSAHSGRHEFHSFPRGHRASWGREVLPATSWEHGWSLVPRLPGAPSPPPENLGVVTCPPRAPREAWRRSSALRPSQALCPQSRDSTAGAGHGQAASMPSGGRVRDTAYGEPQSGPSELARNLGLCKVGEPGSDSSSAT